MVYCTDSITYEMGIALISITSISYLSVIIESGIRLVFISCNLDHAQ